METAAKAIIAWAKKMDVLVVLAMMKNFMTFILVNLFKPYKLSFWTPKRLKKAISGKSDQLLAVL